MDLHQQALQIYDLMLEAALESQQCGPKRLQLTGPWLWLLTEFGETYGIRDTYAKLAHLRWVIRCQHLPYPNHLMRLAETSHAHHDSMHMSLSFTPAPRSKGSSVLQNSLRSSRNTVRS